MRQCRNVTCIFVKNIIAVEKRRDQSERLSYKKESNIISLAVTVQYQVVKVGRDGKNDLGCLCLHVLPAHYLTFGSPPPHPFI